MKGRVRMLRPLAIATMLLMPGIATAHNAACWATDGVIDDI
jgi:hypothetical protein